MGLLTLVTLLAMGLWFSASAVVPQMTAEWGLSSGQQSWMTMSVQIGFVVGALLSAPLNVADRVPTHHLLAASALLGATVNAAIALLVGTLALGLALPHLLNALPLFGGPSGIPPWRTVVLVASGLAALSGVLAALFVHEGPYLTKAHGFHWRHAEIGLRDRPTRLANFGYWGHMWEVYAMWTWVPFLLASYQQADWSA